MGGGLSRYASYCMFHGPLLWSVGSGRIGSLCVFQCAQSMRLMLSVRTLVWWTSLIAIRDLAPE
eukprot:scaffold101762_cov23-Attheya_sp.AAC.1